VRSIDTDAPFRPLTGVRIVDAGRWIAAPWTSQVLSWLGACVVRVEPPGGDPLLGLAQGPSSTAQCLYDDANRGKQIIIPDDEAAYVATILEQVTDADVLIDDHTPAEQQRLGLELATLRLRHATLVIVSVTGHGLSGPAADRAACELTAYHAGGEGATLPSENVYRLFPDRPPVRAGCFLADHDTGLTAAVAALGALYGRVRSGAGDLVEIAADEVECGLNRTTLSRAFFEHHDYDRTYRGYDYAGALRCRDGWVAIRPVEERHWQSFCGQIGRPDLADHPLFADRGLRYDNADALTVELERYTSIRPREEVREALLAASCPGGPFLEPSELANDPAIASRRLLGSVPSGGVAPVRSFRVGRRIRDAAKAPERIKPGELPLSGLRVVDLTWVAAGPYATELLAFLGAEVVRIESPATPDLFRRNMSDPSADLDSSIRFMDLNQAKKSVVADLKTDEGRERVLQMVEAADVIVENYRPGVRDRLGLSDETLLARNPSLVIVALSGFGTDALDANRPGYASVFNAEGGLGAMTGYPDAPPSDIRDTNDLRGGTNACLAALAALWHVAHGGGGLVVDAATRDALVVLQGHLMLAASRGARPVRSGNRLDFAAPYDCFRSADGRWVAIGVRTDDEWSRLAPLLAEQAGNQDFASWRRRVARRDEVDALVAAYVAARSASEVIDEIGAARVPVGLSAAASDLLADAHMRSRETFRLIQHPRLGAITLVGAPFRLHSVEGSDYPRPPLLGEHGDLVTKTWLGSAARV
jgi:crotonobetainyl-CoA:carnitine CoA-transferase CaiB-like acyl-CoA transferase